VDLLIELDLAVSREPFLMGKQRDQRIDEDPHDSAAES
jgi:hypothetical protein